MVIAAAGSGGPGRAEPQLSQPSLDCGRMRSSLTPLGPPVSRDRVIASFPKWYTPEACLQLREHFHGQVSAACQRRNTGTVGLKLSKVVVVGDLYVGKTSLSAQYAHPQGFLTAMNQPHSPRPLSPGYAHSSHPSRAVASRRWRAPCRQPSDQYCSPRAWHTAAAL
uniref:cDNA FLJ51216, highly similar to Ras-related protein Rab-36 n=1 Tax=Homo sapiens TaxID=9606 RepID=B4DJF4_HUMAN|nr:unnamed protein product [Homo sapiens]